MNQESPTTRIFNRIARRAILIFFLAIGICVAFAAFPINDRRLMGLIAVSAVLVMILAAVTLVCATVLRDAANNNWQFSLRTLLIATTLVAAVLGIIVWMSQTG